MSRRVGKESQTICRVRDRVSYHMFFCWLNSTDTELLPGDSQPSILPPRQPRIARRLPLTASTSNGTIDPFVTNGEDTKQEAAESCRNLGETLPPTVKRERTFITSNSGTLLNARRNSMLPLSQFGPNHPDLLPSRLLCDKLRRLRARFYDSSNEGSRQSSRGWRGRCHQCF